MAGMGATVAIIEGKTILLTLREDFEVWCMPGGEVDEGESLANAARREVREETGLEVELTRLVGTYSRVGWRNLHILLFAARITGGVLSPDPHEVLEARFFPLDGLSEHLMFGQAHRIQDVISGVTGVATTEYVTAPKDFPEDRAEWYARRDRSGLGRREFYLRYTPPLLPEQIKAEVAGVRVDGEKD